MSSSHRLFRHPHTQWYLPPHRCYQHSSRCLYPNDVIARLRWGIDCSQISSIAAGMNPAAALITVALWAIGIDASDAFPHDSARNNRRIETSDEPKVIVNDITTQELSLSSVLQPSSQCWMTSITNVDRFSNDGDGTDIPFISGSTYCAAMTEDQLDILALELTHCELTKAKREMFVTRQPHLSSNNVASNESSSACRLGSSDPYRFYQASTCLELMTDHAHSIYHQIRLHTKNLCNRLADEMFQRQKEEMTHQLALQMQAVLKGTASTIEELNFQSALLQDHSNLMKEHQLDLENMYQTRKREEANQSLVMKEYRLELEHMYEARKREDAEVDRLRKLREEGALDLLQQQATLIKSQQVDFQDMLREKEELLEEKVKERMRELDQMQETIATAHSQIRPLSKIEAYVKLATDGFAIFQTLLNFFVSLNVVWICTSLSVFSQAKLRLYGVITMGCALELVVIWYAESEVLQNLGDLDDVISTIRYWARLCSIAILFISTLVSYVYAPSSEPGNYETKMNDLLRSQTELVAQLNAIQPEGRLLTGRKPEPFEERDDQHAKPARKFHPVSKNSMLKSKEHYSSATKSRPVVTPYRPIGNRDLPTAGAEISRQHNTIKILKEVQRDHIHTSANHGGGYSSSGTNESISVNLSFAKPNRKRKFSETCDDEPQTTIVLRGAHHDDESLSSVSDSTSSTVDPKKYKTVESSIY